MSTALDKQYESMVALVEKTTQTVATNTDAIKENSRVMKQVMTTIECCKSSSGHGSRGRSAAVA